MTIAELPRLRWLLGTVLIAAAALFAIGAFTESDTHHERGAAVESGEHNEASERTADERILGVHLESTPLVVLAVIISVALAAATWRRDHKLILLATSVFAAAFAVLDVAEFSHQVRQSGATIALVAATIAVLHAAAALLAEQRRTAA